MSAGIYLFKVGTQDKHRAVCTARPFKDVSLTINHAACSFQGWLLRKAQWKKYWYHLLYQLSWTDSQYTDNSIFHPSLFVLFMCISLLVFELNNRMASKKGKDNKILLLTKMQSFFKSKGKSFIWDRVWISAKVCLGFLVKLTSFSRSSLLFCEKVNQKDNKLEKNTPGGTLLALKKKWRFQSN